MADLLPSVLRLSSDFAFAVSVPLFVSEKVHMSARRLEPTPTSARTHTHTHGKDELLGGRGCSHNIFSLLAFFCGSKSGSMFVDAEGGINVCM